MKLFFTPEDTDDPVNNAKRYFLQTGMSSYIIYIFIQGQYYEGIRSCFTERYFLFCCCFIPLTYSTELGGAPQLKIR